jgi:glutathione S-transferase
MTDKPILTGRSSSHFTRVARIFAAELEVEYVFRVLGNLLSRAPEDYGGNPALKLPVLQTERGSFFGTLNVCRELSRSSQRRPSIVWPEQLESDIAVNTQELALSAMSTEVTIVMAKLAAPDSAEDEKLRASLDGCLRWLEQHAPRALSGLPGDRSLSFLEVTLFCLVEHLQFRALADLTPYPSLTAFARQFGTRTSAQSTPFRFDT